MKAGYGRRFSVWEAEGSGHFSPTHLRTDRRPLIEDFAASAVSAIRDCQPSGPYVLAGWSVWGLVAFEVAQQLAAASEDVHSIAMVDTFLPLTSRPLSKVEQLATWARLEQRRLAYHVKKVRRHDAALTTGYLKARFESLIRYRVRPMVQAAFAREPVESILSAKDFGALVLEANMKYEAKPYAGRVLLCAASDRSDGEVHDYVSGWKDVLRGELDVLVLNGDHSQIFDTENVRPLVERLRTIVAFDSAERV